MMASSIFLLWRVSADKDVNEPEDVRVIDRPECTYRHFINALPPVSLDFLIGFCEANLKSVVVSVTSSII
jgi:hypothetical protein